MTKQQKEAIKELTIFIDELSNKPRRLFQALRTFSDAFNEDNEEIIKKIDEFEDNYYLHLSLPEIAKDIMEARKEAKLELRDKDNKTDGYNYGVNEACNLMAEKILVDLTRNY